MVERVRVFNQNAVMQGGLDLRLVWCNRFRRPAGWRDELFRLGADLTAFVLVEENPFCAKVNGVRIQVREGDLLVLRGGDAYEWGGLGQGGNRFLSVGLSLRQRDGRDILGERAFAKQYRLGNLAGYRAHVKAIARQLKVRGAEQTLGVLHAVLGWVRFVLRETRAPVRRNTRLRVEAVQRVLQAQAWAESRLDQPIKLADWARSAGWSPVQFGRVFRMETAYRPMRWLEERRIEAGAELLRNSDFTVGQVSERVGYANPFYFSRVFKKHQGVSPLRYRQAGPASRRAKA